VSAGYFWSGDRRGNWQTVDRSVRSLCLRHPAIPGAYSRVCRAHGAVDCDLPFPALTTRKRQLSKAVSAQIIASWL
jgi:hypothetical protein